MRALYRADDRFRKEVPDDPVPALLAERPTKNAIEGLEWALQLAPFDASLRWLVTQQMVSEKRYEDAARTVAPLAYSPHPGELTEEARKLLKDVEAKLTQGEGPPPDTRAVE